MRVSGQDKIDGRDVYVLSAIRFDNKREGLYFDVENGLLRRRISYMSTIVAAIPQQTDFEDYREVEDLKLPFMITVSSVDRGSLLITRKFAEIKVNVRVNQSKFDRP